MRTFDRSFAADLALWEEGQITMEELERRHPTEDVRGITSVWSTLNAAAHEPTPETSLRWAALRHRLGAQEPEEATTVVTRLRRFAVVGSLAAVITTGTAIAYAAGSPPVRDALDGVMDRITTIFVERPTVEEADPTADVPTTRPRTTTSDVDGVSNDRAPVTAEKSDEGSTTSTGTQTRPAPTFDDFDDHQQQQQDGGTGGYPAGYATPSATWNPCQTPPPPYQGFGSCEPSPTPEPSPSPEPTPSPREDPSPSPSPE